MSMLLDILLIAVVYVATVTAISSFLIGASKDDE